MRCLTILPLIAVAAVVSDANAFGDRHLSEHESHRTLKHKHEKKHQKQQKIEKADPAIKGSDVKGRKGIHLAAADLQESAIEHKRAGKDKKAARNGESAAESFAHSNATTVNIDYGHEGGRKKKRSDVNSGMDEKKTRKGPHHDPLPAEERRHKPLEEKKSLEWYRNHVANLNDEKEQSNQSPKSPLVAAGLLGVSLCATLWMVFH